MLSSVTQVTDRVRLDKAIDGPWSGCMICSMNESLHPVQIEGFRRMTPAQKLRAVCDLYHAGIRLKMAGLKLAHPDWPAERLEYEARRSLLHAGT